MTTIITIEAVGQVGQLSAIEIPQLKSTGRTPDDFVPASWRIIKSVKGELNDDNLPDYVMIIEVKNDVLKKNAIDTFRNEVPRLLAVLLSDKKKLRLDIQTHTVILPSAFGGNFDPIEFNEPLAINDLEKTLTISMYGGLRQRWSVNYTFGKQGIEWVMLTADKSVYDSTSDEEDYQSYEFDFMTKKVKEGKTGQVKDFTWDKKLTLKNFEPFENEILPDIRI